MSNLLRKTTGSVFISILVTAAMVVSSCSNSNEASDTEQQESGNRTAKEAAEAEAELTPVRGGSMIFAVEAESAAGYCLPTSQFAGAGNQVASAIFDPLFRLNADFEPVPYLAKSFVWNSGFTELTVSLRPDVKFQDGSPLTSATVARSLKLYFGKPDMVAETGIQALLSSVIYQNIDRVEATDEQTVVISTKEPWPALPSFLSGVATGIMAEAQMASGPEQCAKQPIGTGPFAFKEWKIGEKMSLTKNPYYWRTSATGEALPYLDSLTFRMMENGSARLDALDGGTIDAGHWTTQTAFDLLAADDRFRLIQEKPGRQEVTYGLVNEGREPMSDPEVRRHLSLATDRKTINEIYSSSVARVANGPFDTEVLGYLDLPDRPYDKAKAAEFFEDKNITVSMAYSAEPTIQAVANEVKRQLGEGGVTVNLNELDQAALVDRALSGNFDMLIFRNHAGNDPDTQYIWWHSGYPTNFGKINDPKVDALLEAGRVEIDPAKRKAIYEDLNRAMSEGAHNSWNFYADWGLGFVKELHGLDSATMPDGSPGPGFNWGITRLEEAWREPT